MNHLKLGKSLSASLQTFSLRSHSGYIPFEGKLGAIDNELTRTIRNFKLLNLSPVKRVHFKMDPMRYEDVKSIREVMWYLSKPKVRATNVKCVFKNEILGDRSPPVIILTLNQDDKKIEFYTEKLSTLDIAYEMNKHVLPLVEVKEADNLTSKQSKKAAAAGLDSGKKKKK